MKSLLIKLVKYYPIIMNLNIVLIMGVGICKIILTKYVILNEQVRSTLYLLSQLNPQTYTLIGQSFYLNAILFILSYQLRFCLWHRLLICSMSFTLLLETLYIYGVNINYYLYICATISITALITATLLYYKNGCNINRACKNTKEDCKMG